MAKIKLTITNKLMTYLYKYRWVSSSLCIVAWFFPFFVPSSFWSCCILLGLYAFVVYNLKIHSTSSKILYEYPSLQNTSQLLDDVSALYKWEKENHPFLENLAANRFAKKQDPKILEDFEAIYINSKDNIIYLFNLENQKPKAQLRGFMIEDLLSFYMVLKIPTQQSWQSLNSYLPHFFKSNLEELHYTLKNIQHAQQAFIYSFHLVFEIRGMPEERLEATLYPASCTHIPYIVKHNDPCYHALVEKGRNLISFLEVLQGGFFWETQPKISVDGSLRLEFMRKNN